MRLLRLAILLSVFLLIFITSAVSDDKPKAKAEAKTLVIPKDSIETIKEAKAASEQELTDKIIAYYFHGTRRCVTCKKIEAYFP